MPNKCIVQGEKMGSEGRVLTVYHGSEKIIASPFFGGSKDNNDYGNGFYCSENADLARDS